MSRTDRSEYGIGVTICDCTRLPAATVGSRNITLFLAGLVFFDSRLTVRMLSGAWGPRCRHYTHTPSYLRNQFRDNPEL